MQCQQRFFLSGDASARGIEVCETEASGAC
jgi:hypothetical protein